MDQLLEEFSALHRRLREVVGATNDLDRKPAGETNSVAVLVAHAVGSEMGWLHLAAGRPHKRDRPSEFAVTRTTPADLIRAIDEADRAAPALVRAALADGLETLRERPGTRAESVGYCLIHALSHAVEHVGQAELTQQVLAETSTARP